MLLRDLPTGRGRADELRSVAERIRRAGRPARGGGRTPRTAPLTIDGPDHLGRRAVLPTDGAPTLEQVLQAADAALYAAKRDGRNLVRIAAPGSPHRLPGGRARSRSPDGAGRAAGCRRARP